MIKSAATAAAAPGAVGKGMTVGSSPGRAEKLPALGLARLLGGAGKIRGRGGVARSSPMFVTRSRSVGRLADGEARAGAGEEGEPSSPKVTCIGQVRIRNKNKKKRDTTTMTFKSKDMCPTPTPTATATETAMESCRCVQRPLLCGMFAGWRKGSGGRPWRSLWWRQWEFSLRSGKSRRYQQRRSIKKEADLMKPPIEMVGGGGGGGGGVFESDREEYRDDDDDEEKLENEEEDETRVFVSSATTTTPPKNALLLMRCRSAPHNRASSLATNRFPVPVSPLQPSESKSSPAEKKMEVGDDEGKEGRNSSNGSSRDGGEGEEDGSRPLVLTRCKSEPARRAVVPEASYCFWANSGNGRSALLHEERPPPPLLHH